MATFHFMLQRNFLVYISMFKPFKMPTHFCDTMVLHTLRTSNPLHYYQKLNA